MFWRWGPLPPKREIAAVFVVIALVVLIGIYAAVSSKGLNWGFGPEWRCRSYGEGDQVCIKDVRPADKR